MISLLALAAYLAITVVIVTHYRTSGGTRSLPASVLRSVALGLHALSLYGIVVSDNGISIGFFAALSLTSLLIAITLSLIAVWRPIDVLGIVIFPVTGLCAVAGAYIDNTASLTSAQLQWHIILSMMAYGVLGLAAMQGIALTLQTHALRTLQPQGLFAALPPLDVMEELLFTLIATGFVLLSFSLLTGMVFIEDIFAQHLAHKTVFTLLAWGLFGILLLGRFFHGWRGRTALIWTLAGFSCLILGYFGSKLVLELILHRT